MPGSTPLAQGEPASLGPYELVARLGSGGMAEVWKATARGAGGFARTVVLKRILPHLADDARFAEMFLAEARLSALLHHANIVDVFACGEIDGRYYLAMEYVHGHDLHRVMRAHVEEGPPEPGLGAFLAREICRALGYAHALADDAGRPLGIVHRDVSLSNVMVSYHGAVKLLDFGIAKALGALRDAHTRVTSLEGKRGYLAPETLQGRPIDARADQFAAGVVLHELLTGQRLFPNQDPRLPRQAPRPPSSVNPRVPPELDRICLRALESDRERRYATCEEMALELDRVAHQLAWGPQQVATLLERLIPDTRPLTPVPVARTESLSPSRAHEDPPTVLHKLTPSTPHPRASDETELNAIDATKLRAADPPTELHSSAVDPPTSEYIAPPRSRVPLIAAAAAAAALFIAIGVAWLVARTPAPTAEQLSKPSSSSSSVSTPVITPLPPPITTQPLPQAPPTHNAIASTPAKQSVPKSSSPTHHHSKSAKHSSPNLLKGDMLDPFGN